jgi:hypothetical protein
MKMTIPQHKVVASLRHMEFSVHGSDAPGISEICEERGYAWDQQDIYAIFDLIDNMEIKVIFHD